MHGNRYIINVEMVNFKALASSVRAPVQTSTDYGSPLFSSFLQKPFCFVNRIVFRTAPDVTILGWHHVMIPIEQKTKQQYVQYHYQRWSRGHHFRGQG